MVDLDTFMLTFSDDLDMCCSIDGCWDYIRVENGDTLAEVRRKAAKHVAEKHVVVLDGEVVGPQQQLAGQ